LRWKLDPLGRDIRAELARYGPQAGMAAVVDRWSSVVGPGIARNAWPARIAKDGTVHVNTADSVWAFELGQRAAEMAESLGVPRLRFAPGPLPEPESEPAERPVRVSAEDEELAHAIASTIEDENLRESVQKAVSLSLARERGNPPI
jgi:hypothetical protein